MLRSSVVQLISGRMLLYQSTFISSQSLDSIKFDKSSKTSVRLNNKFNGIWSASALGHVHNGVNKAWGCGSPVVKVSNHGWHVMSSIPVPLKTRRVGQRCTLNLSRAETSSRWCGVVVRRGGCQLRCRPRHLTMVQNYVVRRQKPSCS
ncbi:uncharacterized protein TNCV_3434201 [Trichonephila clavipes]|nr:uncharacterized protein TNCV_3434201 [Trichonephila clavipes]